MKHFYHLALATAAILSCNPASSQKAIVSLKSGETIEYAASDINYIQFVDNSVPEVDNILTPEYIPDQYFRAYVKKVIANNKSTYSSAQAAAYTGEINLSTQSYWDCASIKGIEFFKEITTLDISNTQVPSSDLIVMNSVKYFGCGKTTIPASGIDYFEYFPNLTKLYIANSAVNGPLRLASDKLIVIDCTGCGITSLDVSGCRNMLEVIAGTNKINNLNFTGCDKIQGIYVQNNPTLGTLDLSSVASTLKELNLQNTGITYLDLEGLENLTMLCVMDNNFTSTPDFNQCPKLTVLRCENSGLTSIDVSGLKDLNELHCYDNRIGKLDISGLQKLTLVNAFRNVLTDINLDNCDGIEILTLSGNRLKTLDVSGLQNLYSLYADDNKLTTLNVGGCDNLSGLFIARNKFTSFSISGYDRLSTLSLDKNELTEITLTNLPELQHLKLNNNELQRIDLTSLSEEKLLDFECMNNSNACQVKVWSGFDTEKIPEYWNIGRCKLVHEFDN